MLQSVSAVVKTVGYFSEVRNIKHSKSDVKSGSKISLKIFFFMIFRAGFDLSFNYWKSRISWSV